MTAWGGCNSSCSQLRMGAGRGLHAPQPRGGAVTRPHLSANCRVSRASPAPSERPSWRKCRARLQRQRAGSAQGSNLRWSGRSTPLAASNGDCMPRVYEQPRRAFPGHEALYNGLAQTAKPCRTEAQGAAAGPVCRAAEASPPCQGVVALSCQVLQSQLLRRRQHLLRPCGAGRVGCRRAGPAMQAAGAC